MLPADAKFSRSHAWCRIDGESLVIGITPQGLAGLGDLVCVDLPEKGEDVLHEVPFGEIEGAEGVCDLSSPADGAVVEINAQVVLNPDVLTKDPYKHGWLIRLKPDKTPSLEGMMSLREYEDYAKRKRPR